MDRISYDRDYVGIPGAAQKTAAKVDPSHGGNALTETELATFRAGLLYVAADLRQLADTAPAGRREQVCAISELLASIASS